MKRLAISLTLCLITAGPALAIEPSQKDQSPSPAEARQTAKHDSKKFCYFDDKKYSEGAILNNRECRSRQTSLVSERDNQPLTWQIIYIIPKNTAPD